jgi:hypothetical protein
LLCALEAALDAAIAAMLAAHPQLRSAHGRVATTASTQAADVAAARSLELRATINRYRLALVVVLTLRRERARDR